MNLRLISPIRDMAQEMCDSEMLVKISGGIDLVAIEGRYYLSCNILNATVPFAVLNKDCLHPQVIWRSKLKYCRVGNRRMEPCFQVG